MTPPGGSHRRAELARRVVRFLATASLHLYPPAFRDRFGAAMRADWERMTGDEDDGVSAARMLRRLLRDVLVALPRAWLRAARRRGAAAGESGRRTAGGGGAMGEGRAGGRVGAPRLEGLRHDLVSAARSLRRAPGFTTVTVGILALAIAGNLIALALVDAYLIRALPFPEDDRLVSVRPVAPVPWTEAGDVFSHAVSWDLDAFTLVGSDGAERVRGAWVTPGFFDAFGVEPALGRVFSPDEAGRDGASVAVIGHRLWRERFGSDPGIVGRTISTYASDRPDDTETFTVVGVLPRDFWFFNAYTELLAPLRDESHPVYMARLAPGVTREEAEHAFDALARSRARDLPPEWSVELAPFREGYAASVRPTLLIVQGTLLLVLLVSCANAALLLLVRGAARRREFAVRRALGAGRIRLSRQLLAEGLLLSFGATVVGLGLATLVLAGAAETLEARLAVGIPGGTEALGVGSVVILGAVGLAVATGVVFGLVSLTGSAAGRATSSLGSRARRRGPDRGSRRLRSVLVGSEIALSLTLLTVAAMALESARHVSGVELGFDPERVVKAEVNLRERSYPEAADRAAFYDRLVGAAAALPGVDGVGAALRVPFTWNFGTVPLEAEHRPATGRSAAATAAVHVVGPGYFDVMDIEVARGRGFEDRDGAGGERVVVVSRSLAEALWPREDPVGRRLRDIPAELDRVHGEAEAGPWRRVVGVAEETRLSVTGEDPGDLYLPYAQETPTSMTVVLRLRPGAPDPVPALEEVVAGMDPTVAVGSIVRLEEATLEARAPARFLAVVLTGFGGFAVALAVLGLYGVVAYAVRRSRRDIAIRMAVGARSTDVELLFVRRGLAVVALGIATGLVGGGILAWTVADRLPGVEAFEPGIQGALAALLGSAALIATWLPARRAARARPGRVLRGE